MDRGDPANGYLDHLMIFVLVLLVLVLVQLQRDFRIMQRLKPGTFLRSPITRAGTTFLLLITVPALVVHLAPLGGSLQIPGAWQLGLCALLSLLISYTWYRYLTWLDPFEREQLPWELGVFLAASASTFLVYPLTDLVVPAFGLRLDGTLWNDWWYSLLAIGMVEEFVKLLPLLLLIRFTHQVNEPFDFILYGSICALGFAFVENTLYLARTDMTAVGGRALFASVAHMFDTSVIAYAMALAGHRRRSMALYGLIGFILASAAHGFYDLWLLAPGRPFALTIIFFLGTIHLWVVMKNNLVNLSPHYQEHMRPMSTMFRYRIINGLLSIFLFAYLLKFLMQGRDEADQLLAAQGTTMGAMLLFLAISFSSFRFLPGYIAPLQPRGGLWKLLMPPIQWGEDLTGRRLLMRIPEKRSDARHYLTLHRMLPLEGRLTQRAMMDDDDDWYLFLPERPIPFDGVNGEALLIRPHRVNDTIPEDRYVVVVAMAFTGKAILIEGRAHKEQMEFIGFVHGRLI